MPTYGFDFTTAAKAMRAKKAAKAAKVIKNYTSAKNTMAARSAFARKAAGKSVAAKAAGSSLAGLGLAVGAAAYGASEIWKAKSATDNAISKHASGLRRATANVKAIRGRQKKATAGRIARATKIIKK